MNFSLKIAFTGLMLSILSACGNDQSGNHSEGYPSFTLEKLDAKRFILDSITGPKTNFMGLIYENNSELYYMFSSNENALIFFDYESGKSIKKIKFENEGPNGVGGYSQYKGFQVISLDSILLANSIDNKVYLLNGSGEILKDLQVFTDPMNQDTIAVGLSMGNNQPLHFFENKIIMHTVITGRAFEDHTKMSHVLIADFDSNQVKKSMFRPAVYNRGYWSANGEFDNCFSTFNPTSGRFIYSFPVDPNIYETDHKEYFVAHEAKSEEIADVKPMSEDKMDVQDYKKSLIYDYTTSRYYQVIYDPYHEIYYRFALLGNTAEELNDPNILYNLKARVILLDREFQKVGEIPLERGKYIFQNFFVGKNGFHLQIDPVLYENEDDLIFEVFKPVKSIHR